MLAPAHASSPAHRIAPLALLLLAPLTACGPEPAAPPPPAAPSAGGASPTRGTILATRPVVLREGGGTAVEITVRGETGTELQVIQADAGGLKAGDRVTVLPGSPTRLSRAP
ncbi:hypothetical protein [Roseomonas indoligenes]|uniref:Uncharacterized protein n=1 Tax=Roseomonas indoligenes TaxID=2820811 RepID=A0A940N0X8_9PROT|nr:hypothetical protein [Pararoseomonas indoligenes]MBP0494685.1 hypothetical protein [Pararoseomonas indoligenes]